MFTLEILFYNFFVEIISFKMAAVRRNAFCSTVPWIICLDKEVSVHRFSTQFQIHFECCSIEVYGCVACINPRTNNYRDSNFDFIRLFGGFCWWLLPPLQCQNWTRQSQSSKMESVSHVHHCNGLKVLNNGLKSSFSSTYNTVHKWETYFHID